MQFKIIKFGTYLKPDMMVRFLIFIFITFFSLSSLKGANTEWLNSRGNSSLQGATNFEFPQKPNKKWVYKTESSFKSAPVINDGKIIVGATNGEMLCLDLKGNLIWKFNSGNSIEAPALIYNEVVYFGNLSGSLFAVNIKTGKKIWEYKTGNQIMGAPAFIDLGDKKIIAAGSYDFFLHGVNAFTGKEIWKYESDNYLNSSPAIENNKAVFGGCDGFLHIVDVKTGLLDSKVEVATYVASSPALIDNKAYVGDYSGGLTCIDLNKKKILWKYENKESDLPFLASPSVNNDKVILGSRDKFVYCFDRKTGKILWKKNSGSRVDASTVINKKHVLGVNMRGDLFLLDIQTGKNIWTYEIGTPVINTPAITEKGIVVACADGNIIFIGN